MGLVALACGRTELQAAPGEAGGGGAGGRAGQASSGSPTAGGTAGESGELCGARTTNHRAGTRLQARVFVTAAGIHAWDGWWDSERQESCQFARLAGAGFHCVPDIRSSSQQVFADASCTKLAYTRASAADCAEANYIVTSTSGCGDAWGNSYFEIGRELLVTEAYIRANDGRCLPTKLPQAALFERGGEIPASQFLAAESVVLEEEHRLRATGYLAADGTRQVLGWRDTALENDPACYFVADEAGQRRCLPLGSSFDSTTSFADAGCLSPLITDETSCPEARLPDYGHQRVDARCFDSARRMFGRGAAFTGQRYSRQNGAACRPDAATPGSLVYSTVALPADTFAKILPADRALTHRDRLQRRYDTSEDGGCWFFGFYDTFLEGTCWFGRAEDGRWRCLPTSEATLREVYEDEACQKRAWLGSGYCLEGYPPAAVSEIATGECNATTRVFRNTGTAEELGHSKLFQLTKSGCSPLPVGFSGEMWLTPVAPQELEEATLSIEADVSPP